VCLIFQSLFVTVFFTQAKIGNIDAMVFFLLQYMVESFIRQGDASYEIKKSASFIPHTAMSLACDVFLLI